MTRRPWTRAAVVLPVAAALLAGAGGTAYAVAQARATGSQAVGVGTLGAQASLSATSSQAGPLVLSYTSNSDTAARTFFARSTGSLPLAGQTWTVSLVNTAAGTKGNATVHVCSAAYVGASCSGVESLVATVTETTPAVTVSTSHAIAAGGALAAKFTPVGARGFDVTIGLSVSRSQVSTAPTTSS